MNPKTDLICPFCGKLVEKNTCTCSGADNFYLETVRQAQDCQHQETLEANLLECENLVFQGGGILGVAYYGALERLEKDWELVTNVKRVAGSSAGALISLFISMGVKMSDISDILSDDMSVYLDASNEDKDPKSLDTQATIAANPDFFDGFNWDERRYYMKSIILKSLTMFAKWKTSFQDPKTKQDMVTFINKMLAHLIYVFVRETHKTGSVLQFALWGVLQFMKGFSEKIADYFLSFVYPQECESGENRFMSFKSGWFEPLKRERLLKRNKASSTKEDNLFDFVVESIIQGEHDMVKKFTVELKHHMSRKSRAQSFNKGPPHPENAKLHDEKELDQPELLAYGLCEIIYSICIGFKNYSHDTEPPTAEPTKPKLGLFAGCTIKEQFILHQMANYLPSPWKEHPENLTFKDFVTLKNRKTNLHFKELYVTAYNGTLLRTEIFSAYHTPNAIVADAIRASISIPLFFEPVNICEITQGTLKTPRLIWYSEHDSRPIPYMDGGTLDNFPIWLFDDLNSVVERKNFKRPEPHQFIPRKIFIHNRRTLGLRLVASDIIKAYKQPYYDDDDNKMKAVYRNRAVDKSEFAICSIVFAEMGQENEHIRRRDGRRTIYIDDNGVSPIDFGLSKEGKKKLIENGKNAVQEFLDRASMMDEEGEKYVSIPTHE